MSENYGLFYKKTIWSLMNYSIINVFLPSWRLYYSRVSRKLDVPSMLTGASSSSSSRDFSLGSPKNTSWISLLTGVGDSSSTTDSSEGKHNCCMPGQGCLECNGIEIYQNPYLMSLLRTFPAVVGSGYH